MFNSLRTRILAVIFAGAILIAIDGSTVYPMLEAIQDTFAVNKSTVTWILNIEVIFIMLGTPLFAKLSDRYGRKPIYLTSAILFLLGTITVSFSQSFEILLIGRALQGLGAVLSVLAVTIIGDYFDETRGTILGAFGVVISLTYALGPAIAGFFVDINWHYVFMINIPVALAVVLLGYFLLPAGKPLQKHRSFDWKGMSLLAISISTLSLLVYSFKGNWLTEIAYDEMILFPLLIISLALFWWVERKTDEPILPIGLLKQRDILIGSLVALLGFLFMAGTYYYSTFARHAFNLSYSDAAYLVLPHTIAAMVATIIVGKLLDKLGAKPIMVAGGAIAVFGMLLMSYSPTPFIFALAAVIFAIGNAGILGQALYYLFLDETDKSKRASGQALLSICLNVGALLGGVIISKFLDFSASAAGVDSFRDMYFFLALSYVLLTILAICLRGRLFSNKKPAKG
ncbi:MFS transporter [Methanobacterium formicicum]|nr:MFS transporter [Methanobacterium formicicum]